MMDRQRLNIKTYEELCYSAFHSCNLVGCDFESEKLYSTETKVIDVCAKHYSELTEREYK